MKTKRETVKKLLKRLSAVITALFLVLTTVFAFSCGCAPTGTLDGDKESDKAKSEIPAAETVTDAYAAALYFMAKEEALLSYEIDCKGQSVAKVLFIDYTQDIKSTTIKNDGEYYFYTLSSSSLVTTTQQAFFKDGKVAYRNSDGGDFTVNTEDGYKEIYGVMPYGGSICGFIINANTVISSESLGAEGGCFKFRIDLDGNLAGNDVRKQMKEFGGLDDYPNFKSVSLTLTVKNDFTPVSVAYSAEYEVKKAFDMTCRQNYVNTYLKTGEEITIPLRDAFILALEK